MNTGVYVLNRRLTSGPSWLGIYLFLSWFLLSLFGLFVLHWRYELPCQDKLPEFHYTPILGCIRVLWLVFHPLGLEFVKALFGWNSVNFKHNKNITWTNKQSWDTIQIRCDQLTGPHGSCPILHCWYKASHHPILYPKKRGIG